MKRNWQLKPNWLPQGLINHFIQYTLIRCIIIIIITFLFINVSTYLSRHWLKASISLTLVMGIAWLANLIVFLEELVAVAYIMTIFIAGQGILLFIILVPLSKHVRMYIWYYTYIYIYMYVCKYVRPYVLNTYLYLHLCILCTYLCLYICIHNYVYTYYVLFICRWERHIWSFGITNSHNMCFLVKFHSVLIHHFSVLHQ